MTAYITIRIRDYSDEYSTVRLPVPEMLAVTVWGDMFTRGTLLANSVASMTAGTMVGWTFSQDGETGVDERPRTDLAQRELGARIFYHGILTGLKRTVTIPAPDLGEIEVMAGTDLVDLTTEPTATFVENFEASVEIAVPQELGAGFWNDEVVIDKIQIVGRRN